MNAARTAKAEYTAALVREETPVYRQAIADALVAGIARYQRSLKAAQAVASSKLPGIVGVGARRRQARRSRRGDYP